LRQGDVIFTSNARTHYDSAGKKSLFGKIDGPIAARLDLRVFRQGRDVWNTGHYPIVTDAARQEINDLCNLAYPPLEAQPEIKVHAVSPTRPEVAVTMKRAVPTNVSTGKPNVSPQAKRKKTNHPVPVIILEWNKCVSVVELLLLFGFLFSSSLVAVVGFRLLSTYNRVQYCHFRLSLSRISREPRLYLTLAQALFYLK
jgi:hypothetical protein